MVDVSKIKPGDTIIAKFVVREVGAIGVWGPVSHPGWTSCVLASDITEVIPAPRELKVGDRVRDRDGNLCEVAAPPRQAKLGCIEVATWDDAEGYMARDVDALTLVEPRND